MKIYWRIRKNHMGLSVSDKYDMSFGYCYHDTERLFFRGDFNIRKRYLKIASRLKFQRLI